MYRYIMIVLIQLLSVSSGVFAKNLDEQFLLLAEGKPQDQRCFDVESPFLYCLNKNSDHKFVFMDAQGREIYQIYWFDNGPDIASEVLYRIYKNGKIGYASSITGQILIEAKYDCAYPFSEGKAKVGIRCKIESDGEHSSWIGGQWQWIDHPLLNNQSEIE
ncbi:WG repeat-containing protein [Wohlfahrtiimonas larvae]|uniref:WG repeat-containing protein n=1 Tax=Wohlfahrtiimonas larvae TaxID=1157986 RepID=A0ABP9MG87_9GAMM|nr:WG repeat-containing protein [Wohlfahrtiimonas larvae]